MTEFEAMTDAELLERIIQLQQEAAPRYEAHVVPVGEQVCEIIAELRRRHPLKKSAPNNVVPLNGAA
jgi:hypothetical protein